MEQLQLKDFLDYKFLSSVQYAPNGQKAAFVVSNCNEEENARFDRRRTFGAYLLWWNGEEKQRRNFILLLNCVLRDRYTSDIMKCNFTRGDETKIEACSDAQSGC